MATRRCLACGAAFSLRAQTPNQAYCSAKACQRDRRKHWQRDRRDSDPDYRENQKLAHARWAAEHPGYSRKYREEHPDYVESNRSQQRARNRARKASVIADMDLSTSGRRIPEGTYRLQPVSGDGVADMDVWIVKIVVVSSP